VSNNSYFFFNRFQEKNILTMGNKYNNLSIIYSRYNNNKNTVILQIY